MQREGRVRRDLGHEVVVVRVEPLRHLERCIVADAPGDREVRSEVDAAVGGEEPGEPRRHGADGDRGVEHLVVERERLGDRRSGARRDRVRRGARGSRRAVGRPGSRARRRRSTLPRTPRPRASVRGGARCAGSRGSCRWGMRVRSSWCGVPLMDELCGGGKVESAEHVEHDVMPVEGVEVQAGCVAVEHVLRESGGV